MISVTNTAIKLPFVLDKEQLQHDLETCLSLNWKQHFNQSDYSGDWSGIALRSATGNAQDIVSNPGAGYKDTALLEACPYFKSFIAQLNCEKETIRLLRLAAGSLVKTHRDRGAGYADGFFRLHIPIRTDSDVSFIVDGKEVPMKESECWYADFDKPHSVANNSKQDRIHLVLDCIRNEWSDELFREAGYDFTKEKQGPDKATRQRMIEELERQNTESARRLIAELKQKENED